ncbi:MAG: PEP-CTERM sorting domain-containing protein [Verrucomicrobia bacterium]|nr:PEP-CTERM sorting domain-containing protein [Verrucomicrobiota bacterium]
MGDAYTALGTGGTAYTVSTSLVGAPLSVTLTVVLTATNTVSTELTYRNGETVLSTHTVNGIVSNSLSFDAVGYYTRSPTNEMTGITVTTTAIPEPQTYIMTFGLIALAAVVRRRIKR